MTSLPRFKRAIVKFTHELNVDGYQLPDGEYRVGIAGASKILGFAENWLYRVLENGGTTSKALRSMGFTAYQLEGVIAERGEGVRGASNVSTISLDDFALLILYAAIKGKKEAIALQLSLTKMSINDFFRDAFGERPLTIQEKRELFYISYAKTINWSLEDHQDFKMIRDQEMFLAGQY